METESVSEVEAIEEKKIIISAYRGSAKVQQKELCLIDPVY